MKGMKDRLVGSGKASTIVGSVLGAAIAGAAQYYVTSGGNISNWQGYAAGAAVAVAGAVMKGKEK